MADTKHVIEILADSGVAGIDEHDLLNENQCAYVFPDYETLKPVEVHDADVRELPFKDAVH